MAKRKSAIEETAPGPMPMSQEYTVLARRYRPQQFSELVGQEAIAEALAKAVQSNRVAHAYLFTGVRGVGKTSTARILAKSLNCIGGPTVRPCDQCTQCRTIASGEDVDVLEIDAASNRGIDQVREIRQNVQYRPARSRYKVYIVDEVHMLTKDAFNALLKTLEEPPAHVKFILATTEVQKIPATILSRCQRFDFAGIRPAQVVERLRAVVQAEGMKAEEEALELVARHAAGSMRDAQSLLDQLLAVGSETLTAEQVHRMLGTARDERVLALADAVLAHNSKETLKLLNDATEQNLQWAELLDQLIDYWRDLMVAHCAGTEGHEFSVPARHRQALLQKAKVTSLDTILAGLEILASTKARMRTSSHVRVLCEMALVRLCTLEELLPLSELADSVKNFSTSVSTSNAHSRQSRSNEAAPSGSVKKKTLADSEEPGSLTINSENLTSFWERAVKAMGQMLASDLAKAGLPAISGPNTLVLRFPVNYNSERLHCEQPRNVARIEEVVRKITGQAWVMRIEKDGRELARSAGTVSESKSEPASNYRGQRAAAAREPVVRRLMDLFGAQLIDMEEGFGSSTMIEKAEASSVEES
jgi:DNA polymerase-3 subunit gamma/tau